MTTKLKRILVFAVFFIMTISFFINYEIEKQQKHEEARVAYENRNTDSEENLPELGLKVKRMFERETNPIGVGGTYTYDNGSEVTMLSVSDVVPEFYKDGGVMTRVDLKITNNSSEFNGITLNNVTLYGNDGRYHAGAEAFLGAPQVAGAYPGETSIFSAYFKELPRGTDYGLIIKDFAKNTSDQAIFAIKIEE
ncbi:hypothetical protein CN994_18480 [Bacillus anthracis]|nr:hypothetical protein CN994_18480 [Bacillus anthracis]